MSQSFLNIELGGKTAQVSGELKLDKNGLGWRSRGGQKIVVPGNQIDRASWLRLNKFQLRLFLKNGNICRFDGFHENDFSTFSKALKEDFGVELNVEIVSTRGWNWGTAVVTEGETLKFLHEQKEIAFELPLGEVSSASVSKSDVTLGFNQDDAESEDIDSLVEMRLWVPNVRSGSEKEIPDYDENMNKTPAELLTKNILEYVIPTTIKPLLVIEHLPFLTPHGRYDLEMFPNFLRMHGKTDHRIKYSHIVRMFQLPRPDNKSVFLVISLEPAIRQGHTGYPHLVLQLSTQEEVELNVNIPQHPHAFSASDHHPSTSNDELSQQEQIQSRFAPLGKTLSGKVFEVVTLAFRHLTGKKITIPNKLSGFKSHEASGGGCAIKCSLKANDGYLYPLERSFFFVHKPPTHIRISDIIGVEFLRHGVRTLDFRIKTQTTSIQFSAIHKDDYSSLFNYVQSKGLKILNFNLPAEPSSRNFDKTQEIDEDSEMGNIRKSTEEMRRSNYSSAVSNQLMYHELADSTTNKDVVQYRKEDYVSDHRRPSRRAAAESRVKTRHEMSTQQYAEDEDSDEEFNDEEEEEGEIIEEEEEGAEVVDEDKSDSEDHRQEEQEEEDMPEDGKALKKIKAT